MAKQCFCGCGRAVSRFPLVVSSINTRGRQVEERLAYGRAMAHGADEPMFAEWIDDGDEIVALLTAAVHREVDPRMVDERAVRHWQKYGRGMEYVAVGMGLPSITSWLAAGRPPAIFVDGEPAALASDG
jgi:hypothetical protein